MVKDRTLVGPLGSAAFFGREHGDDFGGMMKSQQNWDLIEKMISKPMENGGWIKR